MAYSQMITAGRWTEFQGVWVRAETDDLLGDIEVELTVHPGYRIRVRGFQVGVEIRFSPPDTVDPEEIP